MRPGGRLSQSVVALAALIGTMSVPARAQPVVSEVPPGAATVEARPALWRVRDSDTTIYLFGTFHFLGQRHVWLTGPVRAAFDASQELVLEARLPEDVQRTQQIVFRYAVDPRNRRMTSRASHEEWAQIRTAIGARNAEALNAAAVEPWLFGLSITNHTGRRLGLMPDLGADRVLRAEAARRGMATSALETVDFQLQLYDALPLDEQMRGVRAALSDSLAPRASIGGLLDAWAQGDVVRLGEMLDLRIADPATRRALFTRRNADWAAWIARRLRQPGTVFFAVGVGHLVGSDSVQAQLEQAGYQVERLANP